MTFSNCENKGAIYYINIIVSNLQYKTAPFLSARSAVQTVQTPISDIIMG